MQLKKKLLLCIWYIIAIHLSITVYSANPPRSAFHFIFENNFEDDQVGDYTSADYNEDWLSPSWNNRQSEIDIISENNNKFMRGYYPAGVYGASRTGWSWNTPVREKSTEMYFSQDLRFKSGFDWVLGGKIPGVQGGVIEAGIKPPYEGGFSARMMWKEDGRLVFYVYHQDQGGIWGDTYSWGNFHFETGKWYNITFRIVLNSITNGQGNRDGILEGFVDGKLMIQLTNFNFRNVEDMVIDRFYISSFFGGGDADWETEKNEWLDSDNYTAFQYSSSTPGVPRGFEKSSWSKKLIHPNLSTDDAQWRSSIKVLAIESDQVALSWGSYPIPSEYSVERRLAGSAVFTSVATLPESSNTFTDTGLDPATEYVYRIKAGSSVSKELTVLTAALASAPGAPSGLKEEAILKTALTLSWQDNSNREDGFLLERSIGGITNFEFVATLNSNQTVYTDVNLEPGTAYSYRVRAYNQYGNSWYSNIYTLSTLPKDPIDPNTPQADAPNAPSHLTFAFVPNAEIRLIWKDNSDNESTFFIERSVGTPDNFSTFKQIPADITYSIDIEFKNNIRYYYRMRAFNADGGFSAYSNTVDTILSYDAVALIPDAPSELKITDRTTNSISISWNDNSSKETGYLVMRGQYPDLKLVDYLRLDPDVTSLNDQNLEPGKSYVYAVKARNYSVVSDQSNEVTGFTKTLMEEKRASDGLLALYNFHYDPEKIVRDISVFSDPLDLNGDAASDDKWEVNNKLSITENTVLKSKIPANKISARCRETNEISVEVWIKTQFMQSGQNERIIALEGNNGLAFAMDCSSDGKLPGEVNYYTLLTTQSTDNYGYPMLRMAHSSETDILQHIVYTFNSEGTEKLYINGILEAEGYRVPDFSNWNDSYHLVIANNTSRSMSWYGDIYLSSIYDRALSEDDIKLNYLASPFLNEQFVLNPDDISIMAYPNPSRDKISIRLENQQQYSDVTENYYIRVINSSGYLEMEERMNQFISRNELELDISGLSAGAYTVILSNRNSLVDVKRITVIK